ncbi:MAG: copper chaperone PCu(A)C [Hyphomonadaceae bacterium]
MKRRLPILAILALVLGCAPASSPASAPVLRVENIAVTPAAAHAECAAYLRIRNDGPAADRLVAASSPAAERIDLYETRVDAAGGAHAYSIAGGVPIAGEGEVRFAPGGLHLKLIDLAAPLREGDRVPITLTFERTGAVQYEAIVTRAAPAGR